METHLPAVIDMAPATRPSIPATNTLLCVPFAEATPSTRVAVETMPSLAPIRPRVTSRCDRSGAIPGGVRLHADFALLRESANPRDGASPRRGFGMPVIGE